MGKQARQRKDNRVKKLRRLAHENPSAFCNEWNMRVYSWICAIWKSTDERIYLTDTEYESFLRVFPHARSVLGSIMKSLNGGIEIRVNKLKLYHEESLGQDAIRILLRQIEDGILKGKLIFSFVDRATELLKQCSNDTEFISYALENTRQLLGNECCRALAASLDKDIYKINRVWKPKD